jgi:hypothetical integral membrane protein (TIGR02206 family)
MNFKYFFTHSDILEAQQLDLGFQLYGIGHIIWLVAIVVFASMFSTYYKNQNETKQRNIKKFFALAIFLSEVYKDLIITMQGISIIEYLPIHLCGLAIFVMLADGFGKHQEICGELLAFAFVPGAASALLFCNWTAYPFFNFMNIHSFVFHGWIITYFVMKFRNGEIKISYKGIWKVCGTLGVCAAPIYIFNKIAGTNYMFLNEASEGSPLVILWEIFGTRFGEIGYLVSYAVFAIFVVHCMYLLYIGIDKCFSKKGEIFDERLEEDNA